MEYLAKFEKYLEHLCGALGHADRNEGFMDYCRGLMLPLKRKSVEPLAAHIYRARSFLTYYKENL